jgi:O-antigen ligase
MIYFGLLVYLFLVFIRPADWVSAVQGWPLEFVVLALVGTAALVKAFVMNSAGRPRRIPVQIPLLALWVVAIFLSNVVHGNLWAAQEFTLVFAKRSLICVIFWLAVDSPRKLRGVLTVMVLLIAVLALQGAYMKETSVGWAGQPLFHWKERIQWVGLWNGPDILSLLFVTVIPFVFEMMFGPWRLFYRFLAVAAGTVLMIGLYLAESRGGFVALGVVCLVYFRKRLGKVGVVLGILAVLAILAFGPSRLTHGDAQDTSSTAHRIDLWASGLQMLKENPILGFGKGRYRGYTHTLIAHNTFVQNMGETGLVGLFIWVALVYFSLKALGIVLRHGSELSVPLVSGARAVLVGFIGYLSASMFISSDLEPFYILMGLSAAVWAIARQESGKELAMKFNLAALRDIVLIEVSGILLVHFGVRAYSLL